MYEAEFLEPGSLIGEIIAADGTELVLNGADGPYSLQLKAGALSQELAEYNGTANFLFGVLTPIGGVVQLLATYTSGKGEASFSSSSNGFTSAYIPSFSNFTVNVVPEPSTMLLLASGLAGLGFFRWRRKAA